MPTVIEFHTAQLKESAAASEGEPNALPHTGQVSHELQVNKFRMWLGRRGRGNVFIQTQVKTLVKTYAEEELERVGELLYRLCELVRSGFQNEQLHGDLTKNSWLENPLHPTSAAAKKQPVKKYVFFHQ